MTDYRKEFIKELSQMAYRRNIVEVFGDAVGMCVFGRVLDTRSVFLWNNLPAASLVAGRAYRAMQWREIHCDRYGKVCR